MMCVDNMDYMYGCVRDIRQVSLYLKSRCRMCLQINLLLRRKSKMILMTPTNKNKW